MKIELTKEQMEAIREALATEIDRLKDKSNALYEFDDIIVAALATEMDRLRDKICILYEFDDILTEALSHEEENKSNDDPEVGK